ncbi:kinesin-like protein Nod [Drosophila elegans]|uniref:kinesin-like protein Nod n=1 Tax=Drosophila elegans TaxID=30023 RepID=UPI0007E80AE6|nr:kinesin-like protein Nod [Drosophila elegans]
MEGSKLSAVRIAVREAPYRQFLGRREPSVVEFPPWSDGKSLVVERNEYHFDHTYPSTVGQEVVYQDLIQPLVERVILGFQCTALAYGQTGTGKSYSMGMASTDKPEHLGVLPRVLSDILDRVSAMKENRTGNTQVFASFIEIYNEKAYDLLGSEPHVPMVAARCHRCTCLPLNRQEDLQSILNLGTGNRRVRATNLNTSSSRSHAVVTIHVKSSTFHSRMNIVDLAGSEGVRRTGHEGVARQEGVNINLGLLSINKVVMSMAAGHTVIPYRDSVLTTVLQESLTAQSFLTFLACISPHRCDLSETLSTLRFGTSAKKLRLNPMQMARRKNLLAARTPSMLRVNSSTAIKRDFNQHSANMLHRTRSELGMTPKAKKSARELLKLEEHSSIDISDSSLSFVGFQGEINRYQDQDQDQQMMPPPGQPGQPSSLHSTAVSIAEGEENEPKQAVAMQQSAMSMSMSTIVSPIGLRPASIQQEISGIQALGESCVEQSSWSRSHVRRSARLANIFAVDTSNTSDATIPHRSTSNLRRSRRLAEIRERSASAVARMETSRVATVRPQQSTTQSEGTRSRNVRDPPAAEAWMASHHRCFLDMLNNGGLRELQRIPGIGPKTAFTLSMHRSRLGCFNDLEQVKGLPIWPGKSWDRFSQVNCLDL